MTRLLVTGFGPFPLMPRNPSAALARAVAASPRWRLAGVEPTCRVLTTAYATLPAELDPLLATGPDAVLLIGVAGRSKTVRVETRATSRRSTLFPDAAGETASRPGPPRGVPPFRRTGVNTKAALRCLRRHALPARLSRDAGRYLCNAAYFRALARPGPTLFIHIPKPPRPRPGLNRRLAPWSARLAAALVEIGLGMARAGRRVVGEGGFR